MSRVYVLAPPGSPLLEATDVVGVLQSRGIDAHVADAPDDLKVGDTVLNLGIGRWWSRTTLEFIQRAKAEGGYFFHWQMEPLLPATSGRLPSMLIKNLIKDGPIDPSGNMQHYYGARDTARFEVLRLLSRSEPWYRRHLTGHTFKVPTEQTRAIASLNQTGLIDRIFVSLAPRQALLRQFNIDSTFLPVGYMPQWGRRLVGGQRDIDVLFLGHASSARRGRLRDLGQQLKARGLDLTIVDRGCYGEERTALLNRTKVVVGLQKFPWEFPGMRLLMAGSCGAVVVSDTAPDTQPYVAGQHFVAADPRAMADTIAEVVGDAALRDRIASEAYDHVTGPLECGTLLAAALE